VLKKAENEKRLLVYFSFEPLGIYRLRSDLNNSERIKWNFYFFPNSSRNITHVTRTARVRDGAPETHMNPGLYF